MLVTGLCVLIAIMLGGLYVFLYKLKAGIPDIQQVLNDVGGDISEKLGSIFEKPSVSRAMSVLGKQSGDARASAALRGKVAEKALGSNILLKKALEYLDITPLEGLELLNDPMLGPTIRGLMANFAKGGAGLLGGLGNSPGNDNSPPMSGRGVPLMS